MDAPLRFRQLQSALAVAPDELPLAELLLARPDLRNIVNRLFTLADQDYAELRENTLAEGHLTFGSTRFMLSHYGMDRLDAQWPRSVKGVLMQGAPVGPDLDAGRRGDWPFPVVPDAGEAPATPAPAYREERQRGAKELRQIAVWQETEFGERVTIAPVELLRWGQRALQARGLPFGLSITGAWLAHLREILFGDGIDLVIKAGADRRMASAASSGVTGSMDAAVRILPGAPSAFAALPSLLDIAGHAASKGSYGVAFAAGLTDLKLAAVLPLWAARRGFALDALWREGPAGDWQVSVGEPSGDAPRFDVRGCGSEFPVALLPDQARAAIPAIKNEEGICILIAREVGRATPNPASLMPPFGTEEIERAYRSGVTVAFTELEAIKAMAFETLVPVEPEQRIATE